MDKGDIIGQAPLLRDKTVLKTIDRYPVDGNGSTRPWPTRAGHDHAGHDALVGNTIERLPTDKSYRGHNAPSDYKLRVVFTSGPKRRVPPQIKRELRRRSAVEPVIGHRKSEHRMGRSYLWHRTPVMRPTLASTN